MIYRLIETCRRHPKNRRVTTARYAAPYIHVSRTVGPHPTSSSEQYRGRGFEGHGFCRFPNPFFSNTAAECVWEVRLLIRRAVFFHPETTFLRFEASFPGRKSGFQVQESGFNLSCIFSSLTLWSVTLPSFLLRSVEISKVLSFDLSPSCISPSNDVFCFFFSADFWS